MLRLIDKTLITIPSKSRFLNWFQMAVNESISVLYATSLQQCCESAWQPKTYTPTCSYFPISRTRRKSSKMQENICFKVDKWGHLQITVMGKSADPLWVFHRLQSLPVSLLKGFKGGYDRNTVSHNFLLPFAGWQTKKCVSC